MALQSAGDLLAVWETAATQAPVERALTLLAAAWPGASRAELARLPLGERDARLLDLRAALFGAEVAALAACARCGERVEFALDVPGLRVAGAPPAQGEVSAGGWTLRYRPATSEDLLAALPAPDPVRALAGRCLVDARRDGLPMDEALLPEEALDALSAALAASDPQAEVMLDYTCPACGEEGRTVFDPGAFLWDELRAQARRLLMEVAELARAYGWREADILALSAARRRAYLELAS